MRVTQLIAALAVSAGALAPAAAAVPVTDLGPWDGVGGFRPVAVSDGGYVAGTKVVAVSPEEYGHAARWKAGALVDLGVIGAAAAEKSSGAYDVNVAGLVVGVSNTGTGFAGENAFKGAAAPLVDLGVLDDTVFAPTATARGVNAQGAIVGSSMRAIGATERPQGFRLAAGVLGAGAAVPGGVGDAANDVALFAIADGAGARACAARATGRRGPRAAAGSWSRGAARSPRSRSCPGATGSRRAGAGRRGRPPAASPSATTSSRGRGRPSPRFAPATTSAASAVSASGVVAGASGGKAVIWRAGTALDLNSLLDPGSGWVLQAALDITDAGLVVGYGTKGGVRRGFLLGVRSLAIAGRVEERTCTPRRACTSKGVKNVAIVAEKGSLTRRARTGADGTFRITDVPEGTWVVEPDLPDGRIADPETRTVRLTDRDAEDIDFIVCPAVESARPRGASRAPAAQGPWCEPDSIDWEMPPRLTAKRIRSFDDDFRGLGSDAYVNPDSYQADLKLMRGDVKIGCRPGFRFRWKVIRRPDGAKLVEPPGPIDCPSTRMRVDRTGTYRVRATIERRRGTRWVAVKHLDRDVKVRDWLIVGMGDSNGSGEGNPLFYYNRCNRSVVSYQVRAARYIEDHDPRSSVTFLHTACSGAKTGHLWQRDYKGTRGGIGTLEPQLDQIGRLVGRRENERPKKPQRTIDAAFVSIGVNDLGFGPTLAFCIDRPVQIPPQAGFVPCEKRPVNVVPDPLGPRWGARPGWVKSYVEAPTGKTLEQRLSALIGDLPIRYQPLARAFKQPVRDTILVDGDSGLGKLRADRIFITQYGNFTRGEGGRPCAPSDFILGRVRFPVSTWEWLGRSGDRLNEVVRGAAGRFGWTVALLPSSLYDGHGYCMPLTQSWFTGVFKAVAFIDIGGPFHPNTAGHEAMLDVLRPQLCGKLYTNPTCDGVAP